jgi:hypothetical protein
MASFVASGVQWPALLLAVLNGGLFFSGVEWRALLLAVLNSGLCC